jgi:hypothetical protein
MYQVSIGQERNHAAAHQNCALGRFLSNADGLELTVVHNTVAERH